MAVPSWHSTWVGGFVFLARLSSVLFHFRSLVSPRLQLCVVFLGCCRSKYFRHIFPSSWWFPSCMEDVWTRNWGIAMLLFPKCLVCFFRSYFLFYLTAWSERRDISFFVHWNFLSRCFLLRFHEKSLILQRFLFSFYFGFIRAVQLPPLAELPWVLWIIGKKKLTHWKVWGFYGTSTDCLKRWRKLISKVSWRFCS